MQSFHDKLSLHFRSIRSMLPSLLIHAVANVSTVGLATSRYCGAFDTSYALVSFARFWRAEYSQFKRGLESDTFVIPTCQLL